MYIYLLRKSVFSSSLSEVGPIWYQILIKIYIFKLKNMADLTAKSNCSALYTPTENTCILNPVTFTRIFSCKSLVKNNSTKSLLTACCSIISNMIILWAVFSPFLSVGATCQLNICPVCFSTLRAATKDYFQNWIISWTFSVCCVKNPPETPKMKFSIQKTKMDPQESIIRPLLFNLYINNIYFSTQHCNAYFYAGDTIL